MTAKPVPEHISDERPKLTAYELQVLIGTTISGCSMSPDRTFDLPAAWARLKGLGLIDRADGIANATPAGVELVASTLTELQHRREAEAGALNVRDEIVTRILDLSVIGKALSGFTDVEGDIFADELRAIVTSALAASPSSPASGVRVKATHRHVKRGSEYVLIGFGKMQSTQWLTSARLDDSDGGYGFVERIYADNAEVAIYRSVDDGTLWVRPREEFEDGRFEVLSALGGHT